MQDSSRLLECVCDSDIVGRFGGDEFVVLLTGIDHSEVAHMVAGKIRDVPNRPFAINAEPIHISSSIGIALSPDHGEDETELTHHADLAMYRAKQDRQLHRGHVHAPGQSGRLRLGSAVLRCPRLTPLGSQITF